MEEKNRMQFLLPLTLQFQQEQSIVSLLLSLPYFSSCFKEQNTETVFILKDLHAINCKVRLLENTHRRDCTENTKLNVMLLSTVL